MKTSVQVFVQGVVNEALETHFVCRIKSLPALADFGRSNGYSKALFDFALDFALRFAQRVLKQIQSDVHNRVDTCVNAQQVHLVQHHRPAEPPGCQVLIVPCMGQLTGKVGLYEHAWAN